MTDEDSLLKSGIESVMKPISDLIDEIAGPAAEELGLTLQDSVRVYRAKRELRLFQKTKEILDHFGSLPGRVPLKALLPIIEHGSIEEDDDLQDRWAALLGKHRSPRPNHSCGARHSQATHSLRCSTPIALKMRGTGIQSVIAEFVHTQKQAD